jgi:hypothetical protein
MYRAGVVSLHVVKMISGVNNGDVPPTPDAKIAQIMDNVRLHEGVIENFERRRTHLQNRRHGAADSAMVEVDALLKINAETLVALRRVLESAQARLLNEQRRRPRLLP